MKTYTDYQEQLRASFAVAYKFVDEHKHPRSEKDWERIAKDSAQYTEPFTADLIVACAGGMEREYKANRTHDGSENV